MAALNIKQVKNIRIEKIETEHDYTINIKYEVNGETFSEEDLYELVKDIIDVLPYKYMEQREKERNNY